MLTILDVRRNGELTSGSEFCNGDDLILNCSIGNIATYIWRISGLVMGNDGATVVGLSSTTREVNGLSYTLDATSTGLFSMSSLRFTVSGLLNGRNITCGDPGAAGSAATYFQITNVLGK